MVNFVAKSYTLIVFLIVNSSEGEESTPEESLLAFLRADTFKRVKAKDIGPTSKYACHFLGQYPIL